MDAFFSKYSPEMGMVARATITSYAPRSEQAIQLPRGRWEPAPDALRLRIITYRGVIGVHWEYRKNLNDHGRRGDDIELLCDAGEAGWELVTVTPNSVAYLKRPAPTSMSDAATDRRPKYRNKATGET